MLTLHVRGMGETCCCLHDKQLLVTMLILKKASATICHYLAMLKRQATQNMSTKEHVGTRVTLALGITILQKLFFERKMLIENPKQVDPNTQLVDQQQIQHSHQQLVPNVVVSSSLVRNKTQQYLITKGPRVIWFWYELNNQRHFFRNWGIARLFWNAPISLEFEQLICVIVLPRAPWESNFSALHSAASERLQCACQS